MNNTTLDKPLQPPWRLRDVTTNPVVRIIQLIVSWVILDRLAGTSSFFLGYFLLCFSLLIFRCSRDIVRPNPRWLANIGIFFYLAGMFVGTLGFSGYIISTLLDSGAAICYINSDYKITSYYLGVNKSFNLIWIWLPILLVSIHDWGFLKTWREETATQKAEVTNKKKNKKKK